MVASSRHISGRSLRSNRLQRSRPERECSRVQLDLSKDVRDNIKEILIALCLRRGISNSRKSGYLYAFVKLLNDSGSTHYGFTSEELFICLRVGLISEGTDVRAATLRVVRYLLKDQEDVLILNRLQYPYFIARCMDISLYYDLERKQSLRLVRRILVLAPEHFSPVIARSLISLISPNFVEKDKTFRVLLAIVCELAVLNSNLLISCGGVGALAKSIIGDLSSSMIEAIVGVLLQLLMNPETRGSVSLLCLAAPYCELHSSRVDATTGCRESRFAASKQALLSVLRSYPGVLSFCHPNDNSGLKAIADILYVDQLEVRGAVLELLYELLGLPLPLWTDEPDVALAAVDPSRPGESWRLQDGFVAAEGRSVLPPLVVHCPNLTELHLALIVYVLLECGLHRALAETIVTSDTFISVRAAVLLGGLLHLAHSLLPPEVCDLTPPLPNLLEHASVGRHQALAAVTILGRMHAMMRRKPAPSSLFLDRILQAGSWLRPSIPRRHRTSSRTWLRRESLASPLLKDAMVLTSEDALTWNWPIIRSILRSREDSLRLLNDSENRVFVKRLVRYFKPSSNKFSRVELGMARQSTLAGCDLINCLLELQEPEGNRLLNELVGDISEQIDAIETETSAHNCLFSPRHMTTTCCQKYFLFLGQLSQSAKGTVLLKKFNLLEKMEKLAISTHHDCYVKLIISSLDYSRDGPNRKVLNTIITTSELEQTRLYATQFLRLILRAKMTDACQWALTLSTGRLTDNSKIVALSALDTLHEACEEPEYLEIFLQQGGHNRAWNSWLQHLGDRGYLLNVRLYSLRAGFTRLPSAAEELEKWIKPDGFAERYVGLIEGDIHDSFTRRQRGENGSYLRRQSSSNVIVSPKDVFVPPHLLGQLVQHELGVQLLGRKNVVQRFFKIVQRFRIDFGETDIESNSKWTKSSRSFLDDSHLVSEESVNEELIETTRLETIIDAEVMETSELKVPMKNSCNIANDSQRTTPEKSSREDSEGNMNLEDRILRVKAALWALGHVGTAPAGVDILKHFGIIEVITNIAEICQHYGVRATALYALSLISTTNVGADALTILNWPCVRHKRGDYWPIVPPTNSNSLPSPVPIQKHHRSLSDGKPELPEPIARRARNRSESAATDIEAKRFPFPDRGETPSPVSSIQRLSQQDAEGYAKLRSLQRHRRPSYSHSSSEMYSSDGRLSLQSLTEFETSKSWTVDYNISPSVTTREEDTSDVCHMGICLPKKLSVMFPHPTNSVSIPDSSTYGNSHDLDSNNLNEEFGSEWDIGEDHYQICVVCIKGKSSWCDKISEKDTRIREETLRHVQRMSNPVLYRHSRPMLMRLRQNHPEKFKDVCLFSEVAARMGSGMFRRLARAFIQEVIFDSPFDALFIEPHRILGILETTDGYLREIPEVPDSTVHMSPTKSKINGTVITSDVDLPCCTTSTPIEKSRDLLPTLKSPENSEKNERLSDEKIIAEILKPVERLRISKSSDNKLLKVTGTKTAISLD